jgi:DNA-directed RNA polymerase specialized sigma24 family protein
VVRSRRARARQPLTNDSASGSGCHSSAADFTGLPVVRALCELRQPEREAVVLTLYLDLPEQQAAAVLGLGLGKLRRNLAAGVAALQAHLQGLQVTDPAGQA